MEGQTFINAAFNFAIRNYEKCKNGLNTVDFDSFYVVVVRALVLIYGDLDIMNPFHTNDEKTFDANLKKFGFKDSKLQEFKEQFLAFYQNQENVEICTSAFINIQKMLIDMFILRKSHVLVSDDEVGNFKGLLYTRNDTIPSKVLLYTKYTPGSLEIIEYFNSKMFRLNHQCIKC